MTSKAQEIIYELRTRASSGQRIVFVSGNFNVLHPGHLRLLNFASDCGDCLVVGLHSDSATGALVDGRLRLEGVRSLEVVDFAVLLDVRPEEYIRLLKPDIVVKGKEFENQINREATVLDEYGGKLIFASGETRFSSLDLLRKEFRKVAHSSITKPNEYVSRHGITSERLLRFISDFDKLNVLVIGDLIIDEYITCDPLGMSQEDPTVVVTPIQSDKFIGGAGIVAAHSASLGAKVFFYSVVGNDEIGAYAKKILSNQNINFYFEKDDSRPTTLKQRYRAKGKTLLRVSHLKQHYISKEISENIFSNLIKNINQVDLVIFSDFNYGALPQSLVDRVIDLCRQNNIPYVADSQSSSQVGDVSRFSGSLLLTPTEREARMALMDNDSGLVVLVNSLLEKAKATYCILTMGEEGILIQSPNEENSSRLVSDQIPALNSNPKDVSGAGDSLLTCASMALTLGATIWEAAYLGSVAAACQVGRVGNIPLEPNELIFEINLL